MFINAIALHAVPCSIELNGGSQTPFFCPLQEVIYLLNNTRERQAFFKPSISI
jgi:hypothetical protein